MSKKRLTIGCDHGWLNLKNKIIEHLKAKEYEIEDVGTHSFDSCDYPVFAKKVAYKIQSGEYEKGILVCGSGIGVSIVANKIKGVRAALCGDCFSARVTRLHNDTNVLCLGERVIGEGLALDIVDIWLNTNFEGGRHQNRINMMEE